MKQRQSRPTIAAQVQRELWACAAGRCQFRGCNKLLYLDSITKKRSNLGTISHIVAFSAEGPRGDADRSTKLATDISNLMLTCRDHAKVIDDREKVADYPKALLLEYKSEHERRIQMLTDATETSLTHVLLFQAAVDGRSVEIDERAAFRAILPRYTAEEHAVRIDLSDLVAPLGQPADFELLAGAVAQKLKDFLERRPGGRRMTNISVFGLAPVPLLAHLGHLLGDLDHVDLFQRHRDSEDWEWQTEEETGSFYKVLLPSDNADADSTIAFVLSISARITPDEIEEAVGPNSTIYELRALEGPSRDFLRSRKRLDVFGWEVRRLFDRFQEDLGHDRPVHVLSALPAPMAIALGRYVKRRHPPFYIYDYQQDKHRFTRGLTINRH